MSDTPQAPPGDPNAPSIAVPQGEAPPSIRILAQFVRDLSFENPNAPESLRGQTPPQIELSVEMNARGRPDGLFEVDLKLGAAATREAADGQPAQVAFHVELLYGGLFEVQNVPEENIEAVLLAECPRFLFPFARRIIADCSMEGGFSPFMLEPIDFGAVYMAQRAQREGAMTSGPVGHA